MYDGDQVVEELNGSNAVTLYRTPGVGFVRNGAQRYEQDSALGSNLTTRDASNGVTGRTEYDARGNLVSQQDRDGYITGWDYDLADQAMAEFLPFTGATGGPYRTTVEHGLLYVGGPEVGTVVNDESGAAFRTTHYALGPEGESLAVTGDSAEERHLTYDAAYRTKTLTDGHGGTTTYSYDASGRTTEVAYPGASGTNYDRVRFTAYDPVGNLLSRTDGNGQVTNYTYGDADGGLTAVSYPGAAANDVTVGYDAYDREVSTTDAVSTSSETYDDLGLEASSTRTYAGLAAQTATYAYWPDGSRRTMTNVAGTWTYGYDADGRYTSMTSPAGTSSATYDDAGRQTSRTLPNGVVSTYAYNPVGALTGLTSVDAASNAVASYGSFVFDGVFNVTGLTASVTGVSAHSGTIGYSYDGKDRLMGESSTRLGGYAQTNGYDGAGNPTSLRGTTATFDADNRRTGTSYAYDGNGNPTNYGGTALGFDPECNLTSLGASWGAGYGADGLRGWKQVGTARTYYLYDGGEPVVELDASGNVTAVNVYAPDGLVARKMGSAVTQYAFDPQGSVAQRLDASGSVLSSSVYDAYGQESSTATPTDPFGFNGRWGYVADRETGLSYCQNRYYDPANGRWINRDPTGAAGGVNLYSYCGSGPMGSADPSGLIPERWIFKIWQGTHEIIYHIIEGEGGRAAKTYAKQLNMSAVSEDIVRDAGHNGGPTHFHNRVHQRTGKNIHVTSAGWADQAPGSEWKNWRNNAGPLSGLLAPLVPCDLNDLAKMLDPTGFSMAVDAGHAFGEDVVDPYVKDKQRERERGLHWWLEDE